MKVKNMYFMYLIGSNLYGWEASRYLPTDDLHILTGYEIESIHQIFF